ncbi:transposase [Candidatus Bathyarchaeota archaeon]|nr:transposase [Candidatus Bathyarchaeota archaeon]
MEDHIQVLALFPPSRSTREAVRIIKSQSGRGLFREFPGLKKRLCGAGSCRKTAISSRRSETGWLGTS